MIWPRRCLPRVDGAPPGRRLGLDEALRQLQRAGATSDERGSELLHGILRPDAALSKAVDKLMKGSFQLAVRAIINRAIICRQSVLVGLLFLLTPLSSQMRKTGMADTAVPAPGTPPASPARSPGGAQLAPLPNPPSSPLGPVREAAPPLDDTTPLLMLLLLLLLLLLSPPPPHPPPSSPPPPSA